MHCTIRQLLLAMAVAIASLPVVSQEVENETEALGEVRPQDQKGERFVVGGDDWVPLKYINYSFPEERN